MICPECGEWVESLQSLQSCGGEEPELSPGKRCPSCHICIDGDGWLTPSEFNALDDLGEI